MSNIKRIYHPWWKWECYKSGFYSSSLSGGRTKDQGILLYQSHLSDIEGFRASMLQVLSAWTHSCDQFLSNVKINRIAWLGQASVCISAGVPSCCRSGYKLLTTEQQQTADKEAHQMILLWEERRYGHERKGEVLCGRMEE